MKIIEEYRFSIVLTAKLKPALIYVGGNGLTNAVYAVAETAHI